MSEWPKKCGDKAPKCVTCSDKTFLSNKPATCFQLTKLEQAKAAFTLRATIRPQHSVGKNAIFHNFTVFLAFSSFRRPSVSPF